MTQRFVRANPCAQSCLLKAVEVRDDNGDGRILYAEVVLRTILRLLIVAFASTLRAAVAIYGTLDRRGVEPHVCFLIRKLIWRLRKGGDGETKDQEGNDSITPVS
jgi:hypothetical protein